MPNELTWFAVTGYIYDVEQQNVDESSTQPQLLDVSGFIDFFPGTQSASFPSGFTLEVPDLDHGDSTSGDTMVPLAPITGRLMSGALCSIAVGDPIGVELLAGTTILGLAEPMYYHVRFREIFYGGAPQAISNFAFPASTAVNSPTGLTGVAYTTGGTLAANTYAYGVTSLLGYGESAPAVVDVTIAGTTGSVTLNWTGNAAAANGYNIYRGLEPTLTNLIGTVGSGTTTFTDTGSAGTVLSAPTVDTFELTSGALPQSPYHGPT